MLLISLFDQAILIDLLLRAICLLVLVHLVISIHQDVVFTVCFFAAFLILPSLVDFSNYLTVIVRKEAAFVSLSEHSIRILD